MCVEVEQVEPVSCTIVVLEACNDVALNSRAEQQKNNHGTTMARFWEVFWEMLTELVYFDGAGATFESHLMLSCIYIGVNGGENCLFIVKLQTVDDVMGCE